MYRRKNKGWLKHLDFIILDQAYKLSRPVGDRSALH